MNPRILKKLCKRAAPFLPLLSETGEHFKVGSLEGYMPAWRYPVWGPVIQKAFSEMSHPTRCRRLKTWITPLKGTIGIGWRSGEDGSDWADKSAYEALSEAIRKKIADWKAHSLSPRRPGKFSARYRYSFAHRRMVKTKNPKGLFALAAFIVELERDSIELSKDLSAAALHSQIQEAGKQGKAAGERFLLAVERAKSARAL